MSSQPPNRRVAPTLGNPVPEATPPPARAERTLHLREFTIDELAREAQTTVRNVRAYQDRGLIEPPERRGRVGIYNEHHLSRLRLINQMLTRGYTLASIQELFEGFEKGHDLQQILGLERAISSPWSTERPRDFTTEELVSMFGIPLTPETIARVTRLGLLSFDGTRFHAPNPNIILAGAELAKAGLKFEDLLHLVEGLRANVERVADDLVGLIAQELDRYHGGLPPKEDIPSLADLIWRLRPLANMAIGSEVSRALERSANKFLGERLADILEQMHPRDPGEAPR